MIHIPIEQRYDKRLRMFHSSAFAIAAGVIGVGSAVASGVMSMNASKKAAGAQAKSSKQLQKQTEGATGQYSKAIRNYNRNTKRLEKLINQVNPNLQIPAFNMENATAEAIQAANRETENSIAQFEKLVGEKPKDIIQRASQQVQDWQNRLVNQYQRIEGAFPILQRAEQGVGQAEAALGRAETGLTRAEQTLAGQMPQIERARNIVDTYLSGDIPETTKRQLTKAIAESAGAGFNPATAGRVGGFQVGQANLAENLRQTAEERQRYGLGMVPNITQQTAAISAGQAGIAGQVGQLGMGRGQLAGQRADIARGVGQLAGAAAGIGEMSRGWQGTTQDWFKLGAAFQASPGQYMQAGLQGRGQDINVAQSNITNRFRQLGMIGDIYATQLNAAQNLYGAQTGQAQTNYEAQNAASQARYQQDLAGSQMVQNVGSAAAGAVGGIGSAYAQMGAAKGASTTPMASGFYAGEVGAANAYNVAPSQLSYQKPTGGFLGIGGEKGGYYYNPSGVYGR